MLGFTLDAQERIIKLEPNRNIQAKGLKHLLNITKDTLILQSEKQINQLYSINKDFSREIDIPINALVYKLPLAEFSEGKHVFVAVQSPVKIVFVITISKHTLPENPMTTHTKEALAIKSDF